MTKHKNKYVATIEMVDTLSLIFLIGGISLSFIHPMFCILIILSILFQLQLCYCDKKNKKRRRPQSRYTNISPTTACRTSLTNIDTPPEKEWDMNASVASAMMCREKMPDWTQYYTKSRDNLQQKMEYEFDSQGNVDPSTVPICTAE